MNKDIIRKIALSKVRSILFSSFFLHSFYVLGTGSRNERGKPLFQRTCFITLLHLELFFSSFQKKYLNFCYMMEMTLPDIWLLLNMLPFWNTVLLTSGYLLNSKNILLYLITIRLHLTFLGCKLISLDCPGLISITYLHLVYDNIILSNF